MRYLEQPRPERTGHGASGAVTAADQEERDRIGAELAHAELD